MIVEQNPVLSLVIVNYFSEPALANCLRSIEEQPESVEVVLVDNGSLEDPRASLQANHPAVRWQQMDGNAGFSAACNLGARAATSDKLLFLNPDISPKRSDWLEKMLSTMKADSRVGVVGAKTLFLASNRIEHFGMYPIYVPQFDSWNNAHYFQGIDEIGRATSELSHT